MAQERVPTARSGLVCDKGRDARLQVVDALPRGMVGGGTTGKLMGKVRTITQLRGPIWHETCHEENRGSNS